jgi:Protein of unknown function (DUF1353)
LGIIAEHTEGSKRYLDLMTTDVVISLDNISHVLKVYNPIVRRRLSLRPSKWKKYELLVDINIRLSNGDLIQIPNGFMWDLSSVPQVLWSIFPPDGDHEFAALIHDYLYQNSVFDICTRAFADKEMYLWSKEVNKNKAFIPWFKFDNLMRYLGVRLFGWIVWK